MEDSNSNNERSKRKVVDLTAEIDDPPQNPVHNNDTETSQKKKKAKKEVIVEEIKYVWIAFHQLEAGGYECIGDFKHERRMLSHEPETFDATVLGVFTTLAAANQRAHEECLDLGLEEEDDESEEEEGNSQKDEKEARNYEGEGVYRNGGDYSGDVNTFSERVFVKRFPLRH